MIPIKQTRLHVEGKPPGNCFAACIASILGVPLKIVPQPTEADRESWENYWPRVAAFLWNHGLALVHMPFSEPEKGHRAPMDHLRRARRRGRPLLHRKRPVTARLRSFRRDARRPNRARSTPGRRRHRELEEHRLDRAAVHRVLRSRGGDGRPRVGAPPILRWSPPWGGASRRRSPRCRPRPN